ncbi:Luminal-binding protein 4 [Linum grandiflorum]
MGAKSTVPALTLLFLSGLLLGLAVAGSEEEITEMSDGNPDEAVEMMEMAWAEDMEKESKRVRERNEAKNNLESFVYSMNNFINIGDVVLKEAVEWMDDNLNNGARRKIMITS